jgi:hypothetical protein
MSSSQPVALNDESVDQTTTSCPVIRALQRKLRGTAKGRGSKQLLSTQPNCTNILTG